MFAHRRFVARVLAGDAVSVGAFREEGRFELRVPEAGDVFVDAGLGAGLARRGQLGVECGAIVGAERALERAEIVGAARLRGGNDRRQRRRVIFFDGDLARLRDLRGRQGRRLSGAELAAGGDVPVWLGRPQHQRVERRHQHQRNQLPVHHD